MKASRIYLIILALNELEPTAFQTLNAYEKPLFPNLKTLSVNKCKGMYGKNILTGKQTHIPPLYRKFVEQMFQCEKQS